MEEKFLVGDHIGRSDINRALQYDPLKIFPQSVNNRKPDANGNILIATGVPEEYAQLIYDMDDVKRILPDKTEKVELMLVNGQIKHNNTVLNFRQLFNLIKNTANFVYLLNGYRAYLPSYINEEATSDTIYFQSTLIEGVVTKTSCVKIVAVPNGDDIASIHVTDINNENSSNKQTEFSDQNKNSTVYYPCMKAVNDRLDPLEDAESRLSESIVEIKKDMYEEKPILILDETSFENGWYNVYGDFSIRDNTFNDWMGHRRYVSVGNTKKLYFSHAYNESVNLYLYRYDKGRNKLGLTQYTCNAGERIEITPDCYFYSIALSANASDNFRPNIVKPKIHIVEYDNTASVEESMIPELDIINATNDYVTVGNRAQDDYTNFLDAYNGTSAIGLIKINKLNTDTTGYPLGAVYMVGEDKDFVRFENKNATYPNCTINIRGEAFVKNVKIMASNPSPSGIPPYAVHVESNALQGKCQHYINCEFISTLTSGFAIGLRKDCNVIFENCIFRNKKAINNNNLPDNYGSAGAMFFHGSIDSANLGKMHITFINCIFESEGASALRIEDVSGNTVIATFIGCTFTSKMYGSMNPIEVVGGAEHGYLCGNSVKLGKMSHGNNVDQLNAYKTLI